MQNFSKLLEISIPTYNRCDYLKICLDSILSNFSHLSINDRSLIKISIYDNFSSDLTPKLLSEYDKIFNSKKISFNYFINKRNYGADFNIAQSYKKSSGEYTLVFGDDDLFMPRALHKIINILKNNRSIGVFYVNCFSYSLKPSSPPFQLFKNYQKVSLKKLFLKYTYKLTFISSVIVKNNKRIDSEKYKGSWLVQYGYITELIDSYSNGLIISEYLIQAKRNNTGYQSNSLVLVPSPSFYEVFLDNFLTLSSKLKFFKKKKKLILKKILLNFVIFNIAFNGLNIDIEKLDYHFINLKLYKYFIRVILIKFKNYKKLLQFLAIIFRLIDGDFFKIINFYLNNKLIK